MALGDARGTVIPVERVPRTVEILIRVAVAALVLAALVYLVATTRW